MTRGLAIVFATLTCISSAALAQSQNTFAGTWTVSVDSQNFAVLQLTISSAGHLTGTISLPQHFDTNGLSVSHVKLPVDTSLIESTEVEAGSLHLTSHPPSAPSDITEFILTIHGDERGTLSILGMPFAPWPAMRVLSPASVSTSFDPERTYFFLDSDHSSPEMKRIFEEDQKVRNGVIWTQAYGKSVAAGDALRRQQVSALLAAGKLHSGDDFAEAAFVFQHGDKPRDFLLAHTFALAALARGKRDASWIAAASLDRYLQSIGQPQIYGTQFHEEGPSITLLQPYSRDIVPPALRQQLDLPPIGEGSAVIKLDESLPK